MSTLSPTATTNDVARPIRVLVPLIHKDLKQGREAAEQAALPYYRAAGEKLIEAKRQLPHGEFLPWVKLHFNVSIRMTHHYMKLAALTSQKGNAFPISSVDKSLEDYSSLKDFIRQNSTPKPPLRSLAEEFPEIYGTEQHQLAERVITTGYKALAQKFHPDTGGSKEDMARLNAARDHLKKANTGEVINRMTYRGILHGNARPLDHQYQKLPRLLSNFDEMSATDQQMVLSMLEQILRTLRAKARPT